MTFPVKHRKPSTPIHQLLDTVLHLLPILAGLVWPQVALSTHPQEALPPQQHLLAFLRLGRLPLALFLPAQEPRASTPEPRVSIPEPRVSSPEPRANSLEPQLPQVDTLQVQVFLDSSPPTLVHQDSFLPCQVNSHQVVHPCHTPFLDSFPPHLELHRGRTQMCLTHKVLLDLACTVRGALVPFPQMEDQDMVEECFPQYPKAPGVHLEGTFLPSLSLAHQEATDLGPWDHTVDPLLQVE